MTKSFEEMFDEEFTSINDWGERKFDYFRIEDYTPKTSIFRDDKVIKDLKDFIRTEIELAKKEERERIVKLLSDRLLSGYDVEELKDAEIKLTLGALKEIIKEINQEDK